ncbi:MAG TPA: hypothetical protein VKT28_00420 [Puia sp.]|nr:hypothetical protein [Puia sp.]
MKITFSVAYIIAFISLIFLIQEVHDWSHVLTANWLCGCFGTKAFDSWTFCDHCEVSGNILVLAWLAGPAVNYILIWIAWSMMSRRNSGGTRSVGFSILFAANPFVNVLAAIGGGGDITQSMRMIFQHPDGKNHFTVAIASLFLVLVLTVPPVLKAFSMAKTNAQKFILIPAFLILPNYIKMLFVTFGMSFLLKQGFFQEEVFNGTSLLVLIWLFLVAVLVLINYKSLSNFIRKKEKRGTLRI